MGRTLATCGLRHDFHPDPELDLGEESRPGFVRVEPSHVSLVRFDSVDGDAARSAPAGKLAVLTLPPNKQGCYRPLGRAPLDADDACFRGKRGGTGETPERPFQERRFPFDQSLLDEHETPAGRW